MFRKRIVICLDVRDGKTTKGVRFQGNKDIGDPVEMAAEYYRQGVDELVFYDITASAEKRGIMIDVVKKVAEKIFIPFCVGGGLSSFDDICRVIDAGAEKVSLNSQAVKNPKMIEEGAARFGSQCIVLGVDALKDPQMPSGYRVVINGGRTPTGRDVLEWIGEAERRGAGEVVLNSIDADGTCDGYEINLTRMVADNAGIPVVASGGAGKPEHLTKVLTEGRADAALIASMVHYGTWTVPQIKTELAAAGVSVRQRW